LLLGADPFKIILQNTQRCRDVLSILVLWAWSPYILAVVAVVVMAFGVMLLHGASELAGACVGAWLFQKLFDSCAVLQFCCCGSSTVYNTCCAIGRELHVVYSHLFRLHSLLPLSGVVAAVQVLLLLFRFGGGAAAVSAYAIELFASFALTTHNNFAVYDTMAIHVHTMLVVLCYASSGLEFGFRKTLL
jgi:hypothetical protein